MIYQKQGTITPTSLRGSHALVNLSDAPAGARRQAELAPTSRRRQHREGQRRWWPGLDAEWCNMSGVDRRRRQHHMLPLGWAAEALLWSA